MPWTFLIRLATGLLFWRLRGGRGARGPGGASGVFRAAASASPQLAQRGRDVRDAASLLSQLALTCGFGLATALCLAGGTSSAILAPKWLGAVLLAAGIGFAVLTYREARVARRLVQQRRLRQRDRRLRGGTGSLPETRRYDR